ncbi:PadR family transcriptional regulator [Streptomyces zaomyceticus]|uniref:PadR family transcriptional regulator n=1 Tax=Streptomyces zaomyceticus TaxID=68286 RepID=UPI003434C314
MALKNAILTALLDGEASGYDLAKFFDFGMANYWAATPQQLYRELDKLAGEGLIEARVVEQERRPNKKIFRLTDAGVSALAAFTATDAKPTAIRDELMLKVQSVDIGDASAVCAALAARREGAYAKIVRYEKLQKHYLAGRSEAEYLKVTPRVGPYLTLLRGLAFERDNVEWAERCMAVLAQRAEDS